MAANRSNLNTQPTTRSGPPKRRTQRSISPRFLAFLASGWAGGVPLREQDSTNDYGAAALSGSIGR
jgi:hypothetical protein